MLKLEFCIELKSDFNFLLLISANSSKISLYSGGLCKLVYGFYKRFLEKVL